MKKNHEYAYWEVYTLMTPFQLKFAVGILTENLAGDPLALPQLFWECMLPEFMLLIFMDRFNYTRINTINYLNKYVEARSLYVDLDDNV